MFAAQRAIECAQLHFGQSQVLTDVIVKILSYFLSFLIPHPSEFCSEGFGDLVKPRKTVLLESQHVHFSNLSWERFFQAFGSRSVGSVAPWNRRQRNARHPVISPY